MKNILEKFLKLDLSWHRGKQS